VGSTYNTGSGNDLISGTQILIAGSTINGGLGMDQLSITDVGAVVVNDISLATVTGIENFRVDGAFTALNWLFGGNANIAATANAGVLNVVANSTAVVTAPVVIDASGLSAGNSLTYAQTQVTGTTGSTTIIGSSGADIITLTTAATNTGAITITTTAGTLGDTINLSAVVEAGAITVTTGAGADTIRAAAVAGTYTGGAGADIFFAGAGVDTFAMGTNGSVVAAIDRINGFGGAADVLTFGGAVTIRLAADATATVAGANVAQTATGLVTFAAADNTLALKIAAVQADAQLDAAQSIAIFHDSGNTYVYYAGAGVGNADDQIIELAGVLFNTVNAGATPTFALIV